MPTLAARLKQGRDARKNCPRSSQATLGNVERDPIPLIKVSSEGLLSRFHVQDMAFKVVGVGSVGKNDALADAFYKYAQGYTEQNERDFEQFQQACRKGRLRARSEADFAADHLP